MKVSKFGFSKIIIAITVVAAAFLPAACSKTTSHTTTTLIKTNTTTTTTRSTTQALAYTINTASKTGIGTYLVDSKGMTLYWTNRDTVGTSNITGTVLANWPVFYTSSISVPSSLNVSDFGSITRADGNKQTTFKGWPLYYYVKDAVSGDTLGQGLAGVWFAVVPTASAPPSPATTTSTTTSTNSTTTTTLTTSTTSTSTTTTTTTTGGTPITINLVAKNFAFNMSTITVPAGASVTINFNNQDTVQHNFALYTNSNATPPALYQGQVIAGPTTVVYTFTAPSTPGTYFFRCDVHPTMMTGSFVVQ